MDDQLIYDVGAHHGEDTAHYLSLGYRVIAIEADPVIAEALRRRFPDAMANHSLTVLNCGIADRDGELPFYLCPENSEWNSFVEGWAESKGSTAHPVTVPTRKFETIVSEFGMPMFLKVDIEGLDALCIRSLTTSDAPLFVSFEASPNDLDLLLHLHSIGYKRFALVNQHNFQCLTVPDIGTAAYVRWSAIQAGRKYVRARPRLKRLISIIRPPLRYNQHGAFRNDSAGPTPMERRTGWQGFDHFIRTWTSVVSSGLLTASWFDVHADRS
jgi:FkbM family methyltransferase